MSRERRSSPLWQLVPARAYVPPVGPRPDPAAPSRPNRQVDARHLEPIRFGDDWRVSALLEELGPAQHGSEQLGRLLTAIALSQGPSRIHELADKAGGLVRVAEPRLAALAEDAALASHRPRLVELLGRARLALAELPELKTRAANEMDPEVRRPFGLRLLDLEVLADHAATAVAVHEIARRPHPAGVAFARRITESPPDAELGDTWLERVLGAAPLRGVQLFFAPPPYDRLLLVFDDGRLAYDPSPER